MAHELESPGDARGKLPRDLQLGSASADPIIGTAYTWQDLDGEWDMSVTYQFKTTANKFEFGDVLNYTVAYQRRIWPMTLPERGLHDSEVAGLAPKVVRERVA